MSEEMEPPNNHGFYPGQSDNFPEDLSTASSYPLPQPNRISPQSSATIERYSLEPPNGLGRSPILFQCDEPIIKAVFIDNLALDFQLTEKQRQNLHAFVKFGSVDGGLSKPDLLARLYSMAVGFDMYNNPKIVEDGNNTDTLKRMLRDLQIRLEQMFGLTSNQNKSLRSVVQHLVYDPMRTCYLDLSGDVFDELKKNAKQYHFDNVFGVPAYERALEKAIAKQSSSVRNAFRQHLRDFMAKGLSAIELTYQLNKFYLRAGGTKYNQELILNRNIILRRFIHDNPTTLWIEEDGNEDAATTGNVDEFESPTAGGKKRKLRAPASGRIAKGQDFWSLVDKWYREKLEELGKKMSDPKWKQLIEEYRRFDESGFNTSVTVPPSHQSPNHSPTITGVASGISGIAPAANMTNSPGPVATPSRSYDGQGQGMSALAYV